MNKLIFELTYFHEWNYSRIDWFSRINTSTNDLYEVEKEPAELEKQPVDV